MCKEQYTWIRAVIYTNARPKAPYLKDQVSASQIGTSYFIVSFKLCQGRRRWLVMTFLRLRFTVSYDDSRSYRETVTLAGLFL